MPGLPVTIYRADTPDGEKDYVSCLSTDQVFAGGLAPEAIIGVLLRPLKPGEAITPAVFARNRVFVDFLHKMIARRGPELAGLIAEAQRQGEGWVYVIDGRTPTPQGAVPPEDIIGAFEVEQGQLIPGSYQPCHNHLILSGNGFFQLGDELHACLFEELEGRA